jgi:cytochrome c biogenesis protein CcmG/thiol:disulfide interchange protein DsbE
MRHGSRIAILVVAFALMNRGSDAAAKTPVVDQPAPDFQVTTFDGEKLSLADLKGQVVVLNFWATWCGPCKRELPLLEAYYRAQQQAGLRVLAVATEDSLSPYQLKPLAKVLTIPMVKKFKGNYGDIKALPTNFVIDRKGVLRYAEAGGFTRETMVEVLGPLLKESAQ